MDKGLLISPGETKAWKHVSIAGFENDIRGNHDYGQLHGQMTGIPNVIFKGAVSALCYLFRSGVPQGCGFLVKTEELDKTGKVWEEHELNPWDEEHISHIVYKGQLILLHHTCHHLTGEGAGLRHFCDWAVLRTVSREEIFRKCKKRN